eukprot:Hpha_TRINITY_DN16398_c2_g1::TRINITY_DN16398_c2_g1_i1::g.62843::m.62843/K01279/TPP1, CLN2; tripeptidyl-peptidase I
MRARAVVFSALAAVCCAAPSPFHAAVEVQGWRQGARAEANEVMPLMLSLRMAPGAEERLAAQLRAASDPRSPRYGQHLTSTELRQMTAPPAGAVKSVTEWLEEMGITVQGTEQGGLLRLQGSVKNIEKAFATQVYRHHSEDGRTVLQALDIFLPDKVSGLVTAVHGLHGVPYRRKNVHLSAAADYKATPTFLREYYNVSGVKVARPTKNKQAAVEFQTQFMHAANVATFFKQYVPDAQPGDEKYGCVGTHCEPVTADHESEGVEAALDMEYIMGVAPGVPTEMWMFSGPQWCYDLKNWTAAVLDAKDPPLVFSVSYGIQGNVSLDHSQGCDREVVLDIEQDFTKMATLGITVVFASGDDGAAGTSLFKSTLWPSWPGTAPHVTAVGATTFIQGSPSAGEEAVTKFGSGGGFSWRWPVQEWQTQQAADYMKWSDAAGDTPKENDFHRGGRATPDMAGLGEGYQVVHGSPDKPTTSSVGGTSASAPMFAALVSLLNEQRLQKGKSSLGFINPLIYTLGAQGKGFRDVTVGDNRKDSGGNHLSQGWYCTEGWDAVTGFGTPKFQELLAYVETLP